MLGVAALAFGVALALLTDRNYLGALGGVFIGALVLAYDLGERRADVAEATLSAQCVP